MLRLALVSLLVASTAAAADDAPGYVVLIARRTGPSAEETKKEADKVVAALRAKKLDVLDFDEGQKRLKAAGVSDTLGCGGRPPCLISAAKRIKAANVVLLSGLKIEEDRSWALEAFTVDGASLAKIDWTQTNDAEGAKPATDPLVDFARQLSSPKPTSSDTPPVPPLVTVPPPPPTPDVKPTPTDAPTVVTLEPKTTVVTPTPPPAPKVLPKVLLGAAAVVAVGALACLVAGIAVGNDATATLPSNPNVSKHTEEQAKALARTANALKVGVAPAAGAVALGLGVGALLTW